MRSGSATRTARTVARPSSSREIVAGDTGTGGALATRGTGSATSEGSLWAKAGGDQITRAPSRAAARVLSVGRAL